MSTRPWDTVVKIQIISLRKNVSKGLDRKSRKLAQLMFHLTGIRNFCLINALYVDLRITWSQNVPSHQKIMRNDVSKYVLMKKLIVHATTAKMTMTIRYTHLWHECLVMTNAKLESMVTVRNWPIGFWIQEQRAIWLWKLRTSFQDHYKIRINTLKLRTDIMSRRNKKVQYVYKCATITERNSSQPYITYS